MKIVLAPDKFKGTLDAAAVAAALAEGLRSALPKAELVLRPMADGGEGTAALMASALGMEARRVSCGDLMGRPTEAHIWWQHSRRIAVIESAEVLGVQRVHPSQETFQASSSQALGRLFLKALELRPAEIWVCLGGTLTADGGWGFAEALGLVAEGENGQRLTASNAQLPLVRGVELPNVSDVLKKVKVTALCDVSAPAWGTQVSARTFFPQKGCPPSEEEALWRGLVTWAHLLRALTESVPLPEVAHTGAGGGLILGMSAVLPHLRVESGGAKVARALALGNALGGAQLVVSGEGCLDEMSLWGKVPMAVSEVCRKRSVPLVLVVGRDASSDGRHAQALGAAQVFSLLRSHEQLPAHLPDAVRWSRQRLFEIGESLGQSLLQGKHFPLP